MPRTKPITITAEPMDQIAWQPLTAAPDAIEEGPGLGSLNAEIFRLQDQISRLSKELSAARALPSPNEFRELQQENARLHQRIADLESPLHEAEGAAASEMDLNPFLTIVQRFTHPERVPQLDQELAEAAQGYQVVSVQFLPMDGTIVRCAFFQRDTINRNRGADESRAKSRIFDAVNKGFFEAMEQPRKVKIIAGQFVEKTKTS